MLYLEVKFFRIFIPNAKHKEIQIFSCYYELLFQCFWCKVALFTFYLLIQWVVAFYLLMGLNSHLIYNYLNPLIVSNFLIGRGTTSELKIHSLFPLQIFNSHPNPTPNSNLTSPVAPTPPSARQHLLLLVLLLILHHTYFFWLNYHWPNV